MPPTRRRPDPAAALLRAYSASARINQYLAEELHPALWRAPPPAGSRKTIASIFAHLHNCGLRYLERTDPEAPVPAELDRARVSQKEAARSLGAKRKVVLEIIGDALERGTRIVGFPHDATHYLIYYMVHDAHHRGQIVQLARLMGHPITRPTMVGMWEWAKRARE